MTIGQPNQILGHIVQRVPLGDKHADGRHLYSVRDAETGANFSFVDADIATEGLRTLHTGERVRFAINPANPDHAYYVVRLDLPKVEEYYT